MAGFFVRQTASVIFTGHHHPTIKAEPGRL
jgi:hypothetical protein